MCTPTPPISDPKLLDIPEPVPSLELTYGEEERVKRKGADTSVIKKDTKEIQRHRNRKEDRKTQRHGEKAKKKAFDTIGH